MSVPIGATKIQSWCIKNHLRVRSPEMIRMNQKEAVCTVMDFQEESNPTNVNANGDHFLYIIYVGHVATEPVENRRTVCRPSRYFENH